MFEEQKESDDLETTRCLLLLAKRSQLSLKKFFVHINKLFVRTSEKIHEKRVRKNKL